MNKDYLNAIAYFNHDTIKGKIIFQQYKNEKGVHVIFDLHGIYETMAIHIHEYGDESEGCASLGGHWNPYNKNHGSFFRDKENSHAGDLINNLYPPEDGSGDYFLIYYDERIKLYGNVLESIIGRSVVIHFGIDDLGLGGNEESLKSGNSGERKACSIIGHMKKE